MFNQIENINKEMKVTTKKQIETLELYSNNQNENFTKGVQ